MAYTSLPEIQRKLELANALASRRSNNFGTQSGSITSGLAQVLNQYRAGKLSKEAAAAQAENEQIRKSDLQSLTEALTGSAGPSQPVSMMKFQSPEVQETASKFALEEAMMQREAENRRRMNPPSMSLSPVWGQDAQGNYIPMQMSSQGGMSPVSVPEGVRVLPNAGLAGFDPSMIQQRGAAQTGVDVANIEATTAPTAARAGAVEAATQAAQVAAIPERAQATRQGEMITGAGQRAAAVESKEAQFSMLNDLVDKAKEQTGFFTTGIFSGLSGIGGTKAANLARTLDTLKASAGFDKLQEMRDNSPTGGALGQVTERELALLQATWGSLEQSQSESQLDENLERFRQQLQQSWDRVNAAYQRDYGTPYFQSGQPAATSSPVIEVDW